jgi:hypothetical protein
VAHSILFGSPSYSFAFLDKRGGPASCCIGGTDRVTLCHATARSTHPRRGRQTRKCWGWVLAQDHRAARVVGVRGRGAAAQKRSYAHHPVSFAEGVDSNSRAIRTIMQQGKRKQLVFGGLLDIRKAWTGNRSPHDAQCAALADATRLAFGHCIPAIAHEESCACAGLLEKAHHRDANHRRPPKGWFRLDISSRSQPLRAVPRSYCRVRWTGFDNYRPSSEKLSSAVVNRRSPHPTLVIRACSRPIAAPADRQGPELNNQRLCQ